MIIGVDTLKTLLTKNERGIKTIEPEIENNIPTEKTDLLSCFLSAENIKTDSIIAKDTIGIINEAEVLIKVISPDSCVDKKNDKKRATTYCNALVQISPTPNKMVFVFSSFLCDNSITLTPNSYYESKN